MPDERIVPLAYHWRPVCDFGDRHGKPTEKRWSWEWMQFFHLCAGCAEKFDTALNEKIEAERHKFDSLYKKENENASQVSVPGEA